LAQIVFSYIDLEQEDSLRCHYNWDTILLKGAKSFAINGENELALQLVDRMESNFNKAEAYIQISISYFKNKNKISGDFLAKKAIESVSSITNSFEKEFRMRDIVVVLLNNHRIEFALEFVALIKDGFYAEQQSEIYSEISNYYSSCLHFDDAIRFVEKINDFRIKSLAFKRLCNHSACFERLDFVKSTFLKWLNYECGLISNSFRTEQLYDVSTSLLVKGDLDNALVCARALEGAQKISALISISSSSYRNQPEYSNLIFHEALACANLLNHEFERFESIRDLAIERKKQGFTDEAYLLFTDALSVIPDMDSDWQCIFLHSLYSHFLEIGKMDDVLEMANQIIEKGLESHGAYVDIAVAWVKSGDLSKGISCARGIYSISEKVQAFSQISTVLTSISDSKNSANLMQEALQFARSIVDFYERHGALMSICFELKNQGHLQEFTAILKEAHENALNIDDYSDRSKSLMNIAILFAGLGDVRQSLEILSGVGIYSKDRKDALIHISVEQSKHGNWKSAESISLQILQAGERRACWKKLAKSTLDENGLNEALQQFFSIDETEMKIYFLMGLVDSMLVVYCDKYFVLNICQYFKDDIDSLLRLLQKHALHELFFQDSEMSKIVRFNRTLRIQWAVDIKNKN
jgi:tetratricopeptide (TPR) repeat protein